ncbi:MAG: hypothetical protein IT270_19700 [Saprospiraceae bacterium]|nr:hypothetical protein [Saprospiraceae bacterium]
MNIRPILTVFSLFLLAPVFTNAQSLQKKLGDEFCKELNKQNIEENMSEANLQKIGMLMVPIAGKYSEEIKKELGLDMNSQEDFTKLGEIIGQEASLNCPKFRRMVETMVEQSTVQTIESLEGTFIGIETSGSFAFFKVKDAAGIEKKIWWMEKFKGSELLTTNPAAMKGKKMVVRYFEKEMYSPSAKDYVKMKVAAGIEIQ